MNFLIWSKSFLSIYNLIPNIVDGIDKLILLKGVNSSATSYGLKNSTIKQAESIINLSQKKINLINLKVLTDECLLNMSEKNSKLLILKYIDGLYADDIMQVLNLSRRTYFRRSKEALKEFQHLFYLKVINSNTIYKSFCNESFFEDIFERINIFNEKSKNDCADKYAENICNFIFNRMKKVL